MLGSTIRKLRLSHKLTQSELGKKLKVSASTIGMYEQNRRTPDNNMLKDIARIFNVSVDYLLGMTDNSTSSLKINSQNPVLNDRDKKDIAKDLESIMSKIDSGEDGPLYYNGHEMSDEDKELFRDALEFALKRIKVENKQKYTPKKYRK
ncbi:helix-turn-helix domain-containing protein [Zhenhengia yiwuensis]|uniref:Helix-turn-helix transcriptional regulator n=1 Tax=Zhenhengia yiwuensis TaxID=2763666 RepID=A0A926ENC8_9FIRM|nr:helix-turn-helix transcriptional regulator [Zhenhengia yiwuensis]MBC8581208.1 helix-turn-helix transcriptional regulator [Zhenhengia yiwuensis]